MRQKQVTPILYIPLIMLFFGAEAGFSQEQRTQIPGQRQAAVYYMGSEDELLVPVNIWGFVQRPGQYWIPNNTDLLSLISFAGGPLQDAKLGNVRIVRSDKELGNIIIPVDVKKYLETADTRLIPLLRPGDTVVLKGTTFYWIKSAFDFLSRFTAFAQIIYFVVIADAYLNK